MKARLKTPITYYGGKQQLLGTILPLIPKHDLYCEPFCGGAAVFWAKDPSPVEVINDINSEVTNFYRVIQTKFDQLFDMVQATLHSRKSHRDADVIYSNPHLFNEVDRAWAFWVQCNQSFTSKIGGGWAYARQSNSCEKKTFNSKGRFKELYQERLKFVQVDCNPALKVIASRDMAGAFFYVDPPYPDTDQGSYSGYKMEDFEALLSLLATIKGRFMLSSYDYPQLQEATRRHKWHRIEKEMVISAKKAEAGKGRDKRKIEVITANFALTAL